MSRISDYTDAASPGSGQDIQLRRTVDLMSRAGALLATTDPARAVNGVPLWKVGDLSLQLDPDRTLSRTVTVEVLSDEVDLVPREPGDMLDPEAGNRVKVSAGIVGGPMWVVATLLVDEVEARSVNGRLGPLRVTLVDPGRPIRSDLVDPFPWAAGEAIEAVVGRLLAVVTTEVVDLAETGYNMPAAGSYAPGRSVAELVQELLGSAGHELTADDDGRLYSRPIPPTTADATERWSYGGPGRLPVASAVRRWSARSPQGVLVKGGALLSPGASFSVPVWDTDPSSAGFYQGPGEVTLPEVTYQHLGTLGQAVVAGYGRLRRVGTGPGEVDLEVAPNPAMRPGDMLDLAQDSVAASGLYRVRSIGALPTSAAEYQQVKVRAVWDPALGYGNPAEPGVVCITAASDTFDRADQNLEDLEGSPGSPLWTEHAYSWAVVGQTAIQRHDGTASLARYNVPMCGSDYVVVADLAEVPAGKWIGPAGRSSGGFDCYCAVVDSAGRIRLELWQAGQKLAELGSYATGHDPAGKTLSLAVDADEIVAVWDGLEVIGVTDTRRTGLWVGLHALGGRQGSTAPGVSAWSVTLL